MRIFKVTMLAAILVATFGAISAAAQKTRIECDTQDIVCARVGGVEVYGKATIIIED